ncbi:proteoglycan 4-like [Penaeus japonicus]|uniref:proteoglycan 4-like n=1 Tax=Penaeus japonicus TaxID=27405 RepID=UPI001C716700|nr:proteoglycan 4-like [Penaeus japonicus]
MSVMCRGINWSAAERPASVPSETNSQHEHQGLHSPRSGSHCRHGNILSPTNTGHHRDAIPLRNPTNPERPSTTSTGPSATTLQATSSDTRRPVTATTPRDPTTCSSPTAACRPSSTSWTATPATWPRSTTRARLPLNLVPSNLLPSSLGSTGHATCMTPTSPSKEEMMNEPGMMNLL